MQKNIQVGTWCSGDFVCVAVLSSCRVGGCETPTDLVLQAFRQGFGEDGVCKA